MSTLLWQEELDKAQVDAQHGNIHTLLRCYHSIIDCHPINIDAVHKIGALLLDFGLVKLSQNCFLQLAKLSPNNFYAEANLANAYQQMGEHLNSELLFRKLIDNHPNHPVLRRNFLVAQQYSLNSTDEDRLDSAKAWGQWAIQQAGGIKSRPSLKPIIDRPLRIGYVSNDICQHTVGLLLRPVIQAHSSKKTTVFVYSSRKSYDWITRQIQDASIFRDISNLHDQEVVTLIMKDDIDILIDLSGHTAGSRLSIFAHRPAPVLVSWLGYFATTGLPYIDAILLDQWHLKESSSNQIIEPIINLPNGRLCYQPVFKAPNITQPPCLEKGYITFGSFNNTTKYNSEVYRLWIKILHAVPNSRLLLKWRTFGDPSFREQVRDIFIKAGIGGYRIELRGPSFHIDLLGEYADIDVALDPFPFSGGLTSLEALYMGIPIITYPQSRIVSRQTYAFLSLLNHPELIAHSEKDYVDIALRLSQDSNKLIFYRNNLRTEMQSSALMNTDRFTSSLEEALLELYCSILHRENVKS